MQKWEVSRPDYFSIGYVLFNIGNRFSLKSLLKSFLKRTAPSLTKTAKFVLV